MLRTTSAVSWRESHLMAFKSLKKTGIQTISLEFLEKWNSFVRNAERQLIELLLTEAKIVSKSTENKFEKKRREVFPENFRAARNKVKQRRERIVHQGIGALRNSSISEGREAVFNLVEMV